MAWTTSHRGATATGSNDHLAEQCEDELCRRLPCEMFKAGYRKGYEEAAVIEYARGFRDGEAAGFSAGFAAGLAAAAKSG